MSFKHKRKSLTISTVAVAETVPWDRVMLKLYLNTVTLRTFIHAVGGKYKSDYKSLLNQMHPQWCIANNWHKHAGSLWFLFFFLFSWPQFHKTDLLSRTPYPTVSLSRGLTVWTFHITVGGPWIPTTWYINAQELRQMVSMGVPTDFHNLIHSSRCSG